MTLYKRNKSYDLQALVHFKKVMFKNKKQFLSKVRYNNNASFPGTPESDNSTVKKQ